MTQKTQQPKYKVLNEQRTQGEWFLDKDSLLGNDTISARPSPSDGGDIISEAPTSWSDSMRRWEANAEYTALAVNNLHHLAEALENLLLFTDTKQVGYKKAKQALARIS